MTRKNIGAYIAFSFAILFSIGCSGDGTFERPDSFEVTTPEAVHGQIGYRADVMVAKEGEEVVRQVVLVLQDSNASTAPIYVVMGYTSGAPHSTNENAIAVVELIDSLHAAVAVAQVPSLPKGTKQKGGILYGGNDLFVCYLRVTMPSETLYWSVWVSQERKGKIFEFLAKPPKVIDTLPADEVDATPATVLEISYYSDSNFTMPLIDEVTVGDTIYTKVVFSKDVPIVFADDASARPIISSNVGSEGFRYRMRSGDANLQSGDAKPYQNTRNTFICEYVVPAKHIGEMFRTRADHHKTSGDSLHIMFFVHTEETSPNIPDTIVNWQPQDFVGQVYVPNPDDLNPRSEARPIAGVTVTIVAGPRVGESTVTDKNGRYRFPNVSEDELHLRVEKVRFEPKEVIVHRFRPASLPNGVTLNYPDPQKEPGNILIGQAWLEEVRFILEETLMPLDLLYIEGTLPPAAGSDRGGFYEPGVVILYNNRYYTEMQYPAGALNTFVHELAHAHQHALVFGDSDDWVSDWVNSAQATSFAEARRKDWEEVGKARYDSFPGFKSLIENAAETCAHYWSVDRWGGRGAYGKLEEDAPNRFKWAEEWFGKK